MSAARRRGAGRGRRRARSAESVSTRAPRANPPPFYPLAGPFSVNKVPLKRVSQAYVIATSKTVKVAEASFAGVEDAMFKAPKKRGAALKGADDFFAAKAAKAATSDERKAAQAKADAGVTLDKVTTDYLKSKFALSSKQRPHLMKF